MEKIEFKQQTIIIPNPAPWYFAFNMMDLLVTIIGVYGMGFKEGNPIAIMLLPYPFWLCMFKVSVTSFITYLIHISNNNSARIFNWLLTGFIIWVVLDWMIIITK